MQRKFTRIGRGATWRDKALVSFLRCFRHRPGAWRVLSKLTGGDEWCIGWRVRDRHARIVCNPLESHEMGVVFELLCYGLYVTDRRFEVLIDCGAFRGISTIYLQDQVKASHVLAFEPQMDNFQILRERLRKHLPEARAINAAVGSSFGEVIFSGEGVTGSVGGTRGAPTALLRLSDEEQLRNARSLLLKMDVEGAEAALLPDILNSLPRTCTILLETHFDEPQTQALLAGYMAAGFQATRVRENRAAGTAVVYIDWILRRG